MGTSVWVGSSGWNWEVGVEVEVEEKRKLESGLNCRGDRRVMMSVMGVYLKAGLG